jgi:hypothetical protein
MAKKNIMRKLKIGEISGVDRPAQAGAKAVLMKRADAPTVSDNYAKATFDEALLQTRIDEVMCDAFQDLWRTNEALREAVKSTLTDANVTDKVAAVRTIVGQYTAEVSRMAEQAAQSAVNSEESNMTIKTRDELQAAIKNWKPGDGVNDIRKAAKDLNAEDLLPANFGKSEGELALEAQVATLTAVSELSDAERTHYKGLDAAGKAAFLKADAATRASDISKAAGDNPVVYKSLSGAEFRKNDDPRLIDMAKHADDQTRRLAQSEAARVDSDLAKRASTELSNLPGTEQVKKGLLRAVDAITDEDTRKGVMELLKAANVKKAAAFTTVGSTGGSGGQDLDVRKGAEDKLDLLAKDYMAKNAGKSYEQAYTEVIATAEGQKLYAEAVGEAVN